MIIYIGRILEKSRGRKKKKKKRQSLTPSKSRLMGKTKVYLDHHHYLRAKNV